MAETKYGRVPLWLYETGVGLQAIATYGWLHGRYGHYKRVMPSYATLARELGVSRGSVIAYMKALMSVGAVRIETSGAAGRQTNLYAIAFDEPFAAAGQPIDRGGQDSDPAVSGVHHPGQPADRGGQPVVQEEDVSTQTFVEDEEISLPSVPDQRAEPEPEHEREIPASPKPSTAQQVLRAAGLVESSEEQEFIAWATAHYRIRSGALWRTVAANGDLMDWVTTWRAQAAAGGAHELSGTDARVQGWMDIAQQLREPERGRQHTPYDNSVWDRLAQQAAAGERPDGWERYPHCGNPDCDETTRMRDGSYCSGCHPALQF